MDAAALNEADHSIEGYTTTRYPHQDLAPHLALLGCAWLYQTVLGYTPLLFIAHQDLAPHLALSNQSVPISSDLQPPPPNNSHQNITGGSKVDRAFGATLVPA